MIGKGHPFLFQIALCQGDSEHTHTTPGVHQSTKVSLCPGGLGSGPTDMSRIRDTDEASCGSPPLPPNQS